MNKGVQPEMLILAREARGMSQHELARASDVSQGNISKYESGLLKVSDEHLEKIATALNYPKGYFYQLERRYGFGSSCTYHRKRVSLSAGQSKVLLATMNDERIRVGHLLKAVDVDTELKFERLNIDEFKGDAERIAQLVRNRWALPLGPITNLVRAIENAGGIVLSRSFGTTKLDALSQWVAGTPPIFMVNADIPGDRLRFTLAHEIGHVIMHLIPTGDMEEEANRFAAEFLMPAREIASQLAPVTLSNLAQLKLYWKVSIAALIKRALDLHKITPRQYRSLFEEMGKLGYRVSEPLPIPVETPTVFTDLIEAHRRELGYSISDMGKLLYLNDNDFLTRYGITPARPGRPALTSLKGGKQDLFRRVK